MTTNSVLAPGPIYTPPRTVWRKFLLTIRIHFVRTLTGILFPILTSSYIRGRAYLPTFTKTYPSHPSLTHRIFIPPSHKPNDPPLPLYLSIHGGGFVLGNPSLDDQFCTYLSRTHNILVVSLDYPKAPSSQFPGPVNALVDTISNILSDSSLPFSTDKVAIGGFSAGGNFSLSVPQAPSLRGKIHGICAFYPVCSFTTPTSISMAARPSYAGPDPLEDMGPVFNYAYIPSDMDLCNPMLSPAYAKKDDLPPKVCIVGCELDMLCYDAELMAERLAGKKRKEGELVWEKDGVRWEKVMGAKHGFESMGGLQERDSAKREKEMERGRKMWDDAADWLFREVYN